MGIDFGARFNNEVVLQEQSDEAFWIFGIMLAETD